MKLLKIFFNVISLIIWPMDCMCCGKQNYRVCYECQNCLSDEMHINIAYKGDSKIEVINIGSYSSNLRKIILNWKDHGRRDLDKTIAGIMQKICLFWLNSTRNGATIGRQKLYLIPMPSSRSSLKKRGFWQALQLSKPVKKSFKIEGINVVLLPILLQKNIKKQVNYSAAERAKNKANSIYIKKSLLKKIKQENPKCIVIDDICTTGATFENATKVLMIANFQIVGNFCLASV